MEWILWTYRELYKCKRMAFPGRPPPRIEIPINKLPWFWIGAEFSGRTEAVTEMVNQYVRYGKRITPDLLIEITGYTDVISWKYIDVETLEEKEFPSQGFVIENA